MRNKLMSFALIIYSLAVTVLIFFLRPLSWVLPKLRKQLTDRPSVAAISEDLCKKRKNFTNSVLFFCSSAGEYEQARPLIDRLSRRKDTFVHSFIFSKSGLEYAKARGEQTSFSLTPVTDSVWDWGWILTALQPSIIAIVRHELWPGFIWSAKNYGSIQVINASRSLGESSSKVKKLVRSIILGLFDRIYVVSQEDQRFFQNTYGLKKDRLIVSRDTKYDRARERVGETPASADLKVSTQCLKTMMLESGKNDRLIIGSAHPADLQCFVNAIQFEPNIALEWQIVIAPHHIDAENIGIFERTLALNGIKSIRFSRMLADKTLARNDSNHLIILDTMGMLAEAYGLATAAFVGGASHYQVHNVLEPAIHGLTLGWGPMYKNSQEAVYLVENNAARVITDAKEFCDWLRSAKGAKTGNDNATSKAVGSLCGAADLILDDWKLILNG